MKKKVDYDFEYEKIVGKQNNELSYQGPEEEAKRIEVCTILESIEIGYSNSTIY